MSTLPRLVLAAALVGAAASLAGCYAEAEPVTVTSAEWDDGYPPAYYDGYVVYYDDFGRPYYYGPGGVTVWVAPGSPYYSGLVHHYRVYGPAYHRWYGHYGSQYRGYRTTPGYHYYRGSRSAPPARVPARPRVGGPHRR